MNFRQKKTGGRLLIEFENEENFLKLNLQEQLLVAPILGAQDDRPEGDIKAIQQDHALTCVDGHTENKHRQHEAQPGAILWKRLRNLRRRDEGEGRCGGHPRGGHRRAKADQKRGAG